MDKDRGGGRGRGRAAGGEVEARDRGQRAAEKTLKGGGKEEREGGVHGSAVA